jgi:hypothetical protein
MISRIEVAERSPTNPLPRLATATEFVRSLIAIARLMAIKRQAQGQMGDQLMAVV